MSGFFYKKTFNRLRLSNDNDTQIYAVGNFFAVFGNETQIRFDIFTDPVGRDDNVLRGY
jgi:hypothetical protein